MARLIYSPLARQIGEVKQTLENMKVEITDLRSPFINGLEAALFVTFWQRENKDWFFVPFVTFRGLREHFIKEFKSVVITPKGVLIA